MPSVNRAMMDSVLESSFAMKLAEKLLDFVSKIPTSEQSKAADPVLSSAKVKQRSCMKAAGTSAALAFPVGPIGWLTIVPELLAVWRIQANMVADIAAMHGHSDKLTKEVMLYCLFNHSAKQALKDVTARVGERAFLRSTSSSMARQITARVGTRFTQKAIQRMVTRWVPVIGALGMGAYVYYDTNNVANTTMKYFADPFPINDEKLAEMMQNAHASSDSNENKVDQLADTVKKKAEDLAGKAKDHWQHYRDTASDVFETGAQKVGEFKEEVAAMAGSAKENIDDGADKVSQQVKGAATSAMPQGNGAEKQTASSDSPIVAGNHATDTFKPTSSATGSSQSSSAPAKSGMDSHKMDGNKSANSTKPQADNKSNNADTKEERSAQKSSSAVPPTQAKPNRDQPHNGLYQ